MTHPRRKPAPAPTRAEILRVLRDARHEGGLYSTTHLAVEIYRLRGGTGDPDIQVLQRRDMPVSAVPRPALRRLLDEMVDEGVLGAVDARPGEPGLTAVRAVVQRGVRYYGTAATVRAAVKEHRRQQASQQKWLALAQRLTERYGHRVLELSVHDGVVHILATPEQARALFEETGHATTPAGPTTELTVAETA